MTQPRTHRLRYAHGAALGLFVGAATFWLVYLARIFLPFSVANFLLAFLISAGIAASVGGLLALLVRLVARVPWLLLWALATVLILFVPVLVVEIPLVVGLAVGLVAFLVTCASFGAAVVALTRWREVGRVGSIAAILTVTAALVLVGAAALWMAHEGTPAPGMANAAGLTPSPLPPVPADPTARGFHAVTVFDYGPDAIEPAFVTRTVDGSKWIRQWLGGRQRYWGFGPESLPLRGRVWRPDGPGPYPLVLVLHGNHAMETRSELGYSYLCELLASRGMACGTVDENFFNVSTWAGGAYLMDGGASVDARAWLLLEHLRGWRDWNRSPGHPLHGLIDESRVALIGHSMGGEAASLAAALNTLAVYPNDASRVLDYGFGIRSVVALAPTDGLQDLGGRHVRLENVDYLALHGSFDMDVWAFKGQNQLERVAWTDGEAHTGAAVFIHGANHGQFNSEWGRRDKGDLVFGLMNTAQIMPGEEQRRIASAYVAAFLEASLNGQVGYLNLLRDARASDALPANVVILSQVHESAVQYVATYEEDVDPTSTTVSGGSIRGDQLRVWREVLASLKLDSVDTRVACLAWERETSRSFPSYALDLPASFSAGTDGDLVFALAHRADGKPGPGEVEPLDFTVELADGAGHVARLPLSHFSYLQPEIRVQLAKAGWMTATVPQSYPVFQTFTFPLTAFKATNPAFDPAGLRSIRFVFDRTPAGMVLVDEVGVRP